MRRIGPHSSAVALAKLDGRTRQGRLLRDIRADLVKHVGGSPSATERILIDQAAQLRLRLALMDAEDAGVLSERNAREYLSWSSALGRMLRQLGLKAAAKPAPSLDDLMTRLTPSRGIAA
ncbi:hypothetical protein HN018_02850 [Lichenicola cladoniae]|uniref:Uncharacterized protein n=1 Tax=Lichenicola cladoniae TaxID=1484109 RepID=A0A6M8HLA9_9PROT|nr:hypothetical protein [Lichenicola cladoniae]NPD68926.1 hypothetical protein [Acetobacteraceae bacterium]QKE89128.1 hypothetical protein HN018_02850 [Lichenicola cladoniae]